jgi:Ser/Thr protein kinase RdoA (MazF antagonist)
MSGASPDFQLLVETWAMGRARAYGLPALQVFHVDLSRRVCAFDYEILAEAEGTSLREVDNDDSAIQPLLRELGRVVARIHGIGMEGYGWIDVEPLVKSSDKDAASDGMFDSWRSYVLLNLAEHVQICAQIGAITRSESNRIERVFAKLDNLLDGVKPCLLHGDLGNHNVFFRDGKIVGLLDWEDCLSGDPVFDIAFWATFHPERRHASFLDGYRHERALPDDFEPRFWLYFLRVALSKTVHRHRFGYTDRPGRPPASRRIHQALERIESGWNLSH